MEVDPGQWEAFCFSVYLDGFGYKEKTIVVARGWGLREMGS